MVLRAHRREDKKKSPPNNNSTADTEKIEAAVVGVVSASAHTLTTSATAPSPVTDPPLHPLSSPIRASATTKTVSGDSRNSNDGGGDKDDGGSPSHAMHV